MTGNSSFRAILGAATILASSSAISVAAGLVGAKFQAVLLGPEGLGYIGLIQSLVGLSALIAGLGVSTGLVRIGANALAREDLSLVRALRRAAWLILAMTGVAVLTIFAIARIPISRIMLGGTEHAGALPIIGLVLVLNLAATIQTGLLNLHHRVRALARASVASTLVGLCLSVAILWGWRGRGIVPAVFAMALASWVTSWFVLRRDVPAEQGAASIPAVLSAAQSLIRFGVPYTLSTVIGAGVQLVIPVLILHVLGQEDVGYYRAAVTIAVGYLGFLLTALSQDYYPRISAASHQPQEMVRLANNQLQLVLLIATPIILGALAMAPHLVPIIYTSKFVPTVEILEWLLMSDLFKLSSWTMGFIILARSSPLMYFCTESVAGIATLGLSWIGMHLFGSAGLGLALLGTYILHWMVVGLVVRREVGFSWTVRNRWSFAGAILAAGLIRLLPFAGVGTLRTPLALTLAGLVGCWSLYRISTEFGGPRALLSRRSARHA